MSTDTRARILSRVTEVNTGFESACWISSHGSHPNGYTMMHAGGRKWLTHRLAYVAFVGPIPSGLQLDHLCRVRECCNPAHLEPVTCRENLLRGETVTASRAAQTHCHAGHVLAGANIYTPPSRPNTRVCRACSLAGQRRRKAERATAQRSDQA